MLTLILHHTDACASRLQNGGHLSSTTSNHPGQLDAASRIAYCVKVKNITVSVDDDTYRRARTKAAQQDTSVSALVRRFLVALASDESDADRLRREERALRARVVAFSAADRLSREDVHRRDA
jgi:hypothetical protein